MRKLIVICAAIGALAVPAQALAAPITGAVVRDNTIGVRGSIYFNPAFQTLGPNGEVIATFNHAQPFYLMPY